MKIIHLRLLSNYWIDCKLWTTRLSTYASSLNMLHVSHMYTYASVCVYMYASVCVFECVVYLCAAAVDTIRRPCAAASPALRCTCNWPAVRWTPSLSSSCWDHVHSSLGAAPPTAVAPYPPLPCEWRQWLCRWNKRTGDFIRIHIRYLRNTQIILLLLDSISMDHLA